MSLFGGALDVDDASSPLPDSSPRPSSPPPLPHPRHSIEHDITDDDQHELPASDYASEDERRPNAFDGLPGTWRKYTAKERDLDSALGQLRASDLSCHLYNAHALNRRLRSHGAAGATKPWETKARWIDEAQQEEWVPPTSWTAWPLEPDQVPRAHEAFADAPVIDSEHNSTVREETYAKQKPSQDLEDILVGVVQKKAKERWDQRLSESESADEEDAEACGVQLDTDARARKSGVNRQVSQRKSRADSSHEDSEAEPEDATSTEKRDADNHNLHRPVILADDEKAHKILQPSVRSVLSKLDTLLINLHHSRRNHWESIYHVSGDETEIAANDIAVERRSDTEGESKPQLKRRQGRPPKALDEVSGEQQVTTDAESETASGLAKRKKGRPRKYDIERLPGESRYMMIKRFKREQQKRGQQESRQQEHSMAPVETDDANKGESSERQTPDSAPNSPRKRRRRSSTTSTASGTSARSDHSNTPYLKTLNLRDWSEVLGLAVLSGFKPEVVQRAGQRCANLFREGMSFTTLKERGNEAVETVECLPGTTSEIPLFEEEEEDDVEMGKDEEKADFLAWDSKSSLTCPYKFCPRSCNAFPSRWRLNEHLKRAHGGYAGRQKSLFSAKDDLVGELHNDGFLEPIEARAGWGVGRKPRAKKRKVEEE